MMPINLLKKFIKLESSSSILLLAATVIAIILANSPLEYFYSAVFNYPLTISIKNYSLDISLKHFINDGLMTIFFILVSLEVKRELLIGELSGYQKALLPLIAAFSGMLFPALIYLFFNWNYPETRQGWAIPTATDIAFSLAILGLLGRRIPIALKSFLTALAIIDDIGAIAIIAIFYSQSIQWIFLLLSGALFLILILLNYFNITRFSPYLLIGALLWFCITQAHIHGTIAGVLLALTIPLKNPEKPLSTPLQTLENVLHPWVAFGILPLFALANAGVTLTAVHPTDLLSPVMLGIALGLFLGKQLGITLSCWISVKTKLASLPHQVTWKHMYGMSILCGIGFTMSLFIGTLSFPSNQINSMNLVKLAILGSSLISALLGYLVLYRRA